MVDAHGLGPCRETFGGSSPLPGTESEVRNMEHVKPSIKQIDLGCTARKIETNKFLSFKGLDGKDHSTPEGLQRANQEWTNQFKKKSIG